jgi:3-hydroxybutyryl-CoA dehydrogenase
VTGNDNSIYLIGDYALVKEWSGAFHDHGFKISARVTSANEQGALPEYCTLLESPPPDCRTAIELTLLDRNMKERNIRNLAGSLNPKTPILTSSSTVSTTAQASWINNPGRLMGISAFPTTITRRLIEIAPSIHTSKNWVKEAEEVFFRAGKEIAVVQDRAGMVFPRMLCMLINEAFFAAMDGIAPVEDIDRAMKLGAGYPHGPIQWANTIGLPYVVAVLDAIHAETGDERYRIAPILRQLAAGAKWWNG